MAENATAKTTRKTSVLNAAKSMAQFYERYGMANRNYEALARTVQFTRLDRLYNVKAFFKNWMNVFGVVLLLFLVLVAIIGPYYTQDPGLRDPSNVHVAPFSYDGNGVYHWLGTDLNGSDLLARMVHGLRYSLGLGAMATLIELFVGVGIGILQGYFRSFDRYGRWAVKILATIPGLLVLIVVAVAIGASFWSIVLGVTITGWIGMSIYVRAEVRRLRNEDYVTASRMLGTGPGRIISSLLPMLVPLIIAQLLITISYAFLADTALALVGLAIPNTSSMGIAVSNASLTIAIFPLELVWPLLTIILFVSSVQLIGNGIQSTVKRSR